MNPTNPYDTIQQLRETIKAQAAVIEKLREALKDCYVEFFYVNQQLNSVRDEDGEPLYREGKSVTEALAKGKEALAIPGNSTQILDEVRRAERERCANVCDERRIKFIETGWPAYEKEAGDCAAAIRAME